jgi:hypothetical protein
MQVCNQANAIKIASDFLCAESLEASQILSDEFREQRLILRWPEDVLQLETTMWYAWRSLLRLQEAALSNYIRIVMIF